MPRTIIQRGLMRTRFSLPDFVSKFYTADEALLRSSRLFDEDYYRKQTPIRRSTNAATHYLKKGWKMLLNPSGYFNTKFYLDWYPDVRMSNINPLVHYLKNGFLELRRPCHEFDPIPFQSEHKDLLGHNVAELCLQIYGTYAWTSGKKTIVLSEDIVEACKALFDSDYYRSTYCEFDWSTSDEFSHYMEYGHLLNCDPSITFNTDFYRRTWMKDGRKSDNPLVHFVTIGNADGASTDDEEAVFLTTAPGRTSPQQTGQSLCVHVHCVCPEMLAEVSPALHQIPRSASVIITVVRHADFEFVQKYLARSSFSCSIEVRLLKDRGHDLLAFLIDYTDIWISHDVVLHVHTKSTPQAEWGTEWRLYLFDQLLGSQNLIQQSLGLFLSDPSLGMLYPANFYKAKEYTPEEISFDSVDLLIAKLGIDNDSPSRNFAVGSMAYFRTNVLRLIVERLKSEKIEDETGQIDQTLALALERVLPLAVRGHGFKVRTYKTPIRTRISLRADAPARAGFSAPVAARWMRDTPAIARTPPEPLIPQNRVFNGKQLDIHWILPSFNGPGAGGHMTIFRMIRYLEIFGHRQTIWLQNAVHFCDQADAKTKIRRWYQPIGDGVHVLFVPEDMRAVSGDVMIATDCWTAFPAAAATNFKERFYFVQDHEPLFHPAGENQLMAELTYEFGFACLCAGEWLLQQAKVRGDWAVAWELASDPAFYFPTLTPQLLKKPVSIAFYARQSTPRRAVRLGLAALEILQDGGVDINVHLFGENDLDLDLPFSNEVHGILPPKELGELYRACDIGLVFSATNYSLIPLEMMACDLAVVELDGPSTRAIFRNGEVKLAKPTPYSIADAIRSLVENEDQRTTQIARARQFVAKYSWEKSARTIEGALLKRLHEVGAVALDPLSIASPVVLPRRKASVVIPTYNAGPSFERVIEAVSSQSCDFDYDVLVIDSSSTDGTRDFVRRFAHKNVRFEEIPQAEFQHGRTRNRGIEQTDGAYVAMLTQDALPKNADWLAKLISGFSLASNVAGVIGRHEAYPAHDAFTRRDMKAHFDIVALLPSVVSVENGLPSFLHPGSEPWRMQFNFYSDNNSAMSRAVWRVLPYPELEWGEDQVWAAEMLRLGFAKAYVDDAVVYHSHAFDAATQFRTCETEGRFWADHFGVRLHQDAGAEITGANRRDQAFADDQRISAKDLKLRFKSNEATVSGRLSGWKDARSKAIR